MWICKVSNLNAGNGILARSDLHATLSDLSAAADKLDNFQFVAVLQRYLLPCRARNNVPISLYRDTIRFQLQTFNQLMKTGVRFQFRKLPITPIDGELHWIATFTNSGFP